MLRIRPQYQDIVPSTAHHISHKSVPKSRFVPASPQGEAFASAVQPLDKSQFMQLGWEIAVGAHTQRRAAEFSAEDIAFSVDRMRNNPYNYIGEVLPFWRKLPKST